MPVEINIEEMLMACESIINMQVPHLANSKNKTSQLIGGLSPGNYEIVLNEAKE